MSLFIDRVIMKFSHKITENEITIFKTKDNGKTLLGQIEESLENKGTEK